MTTTKKKTTTRKATTKAAEASKKAKQSAAAVKSRTAATASASAPSTKAPTSPLQASQPADRAAKPTLVDAPEAVVIGPRMRKKEIVDEVVSRTGMKKRDVKPIVESLFGVLGEAMADGRELVLPPLGRIKVHKQKTTPKKKIFFAKVHQNLPPSATPGSDPKSGEG